MSKEIDIKLHISELKDIERRVLLKADEMINILRLGMRLDDDLLCNNNEVLKLKKQTVLNKLKKNSEVATKKFVDNIIEEIDDISLLVNIELANENITPSYYQKLKNLKHKTLLVRKNIEQYNIFEISRHIDATVKCIESGKRINLNYTSTQKPQHSDKTRQYTVTKPARYVPFPMK